MHLSDLRVYGVVDDNTYVFFVQQPLRYCTSYHRHS